MVKWRKIIFYQEELADLANVNLRTIQRMENNENSPRPDTLDLVCKAMGMDVSQIPKGSPQKTRTTNYLDVILDYIFLIVINLTLMGIVGYMTLDSNASLNSLFAGLLLSFFIPSFIVLKTLNMKRHERTLKFGSGYILYTILSMIIVGIPVSFAPFSNLLYSC